MDKPRLSTAVPVLAVLLLTSGIVVGWILLAAQRNIVQLTQITNTTTLPSIQNQVRTVTNIERLRVFGEIVYTSRNARARREARLAATVLAQDTAAYEPDTDVKNHMTRIAARVNRMAAQRDECDAALRQLDETLALLDFWLEHARPMTATPFAILDPRFHALYWLRVLLARLRSASDLSQVAGLEREFAARQTQIAEILDAPPSSIQFPAAQPSLTMVQLRRLFGLQAATLEAETVVSRLQIEIRQSFDDLARRTTVDNTITLHESTTAITEHASQIYRTVVVACSGMALILLASLYVFRQMIIEPINRLARELTLVRVARTTVPRHPERFRELDDIAMAIQEFGQALDQIGQRTAELEREIAERQQAQARLVELATTDDLTGLRNRRCFMETATQEFERARRYRTPLSLLMLDADQFKSINDRFGHPVGDLALQILAATGQRQLREIDLFARLGGEEFAVLLPQTGFADAWTTAERLRQVIAEQAVATAQGPLHFTVSLGLASLDSTTADLGDLLRQADAALYQAKRNGRNRVEPAPT